MKLLVPPAFTLAAVATTRAGAPVPPPPEAEGPLAEVRHVMAVYARRFAGRPRSTRDPDLLDELLGRLEAQRGRLVALQGTRPAALAAPLQEVAANLSVLGHERQQLRTATAGFSPEIRGECVASRITEAVELYRMHFEMRPRLSRRPGLAWRLARTFDRLADELEGVPGDDARANAAYVASVRAHVRGEAEAVAAEVGAADRARRVEALLEAAQEEIDAFATRFAPFPRERWSRDELGAVCERLGEVCLQLRELADAGAEVPQAAAIRGCLDAYERAWSELGLAGEGL